MHDIQLGMLLVLLRQRWRYAPEGMMVRTQRYERFHGLVLHPLLCVLYDGILQGTDDDRVAARQETEVLKQWSKLVSK